MDRLKKIQEEIKSLLLNEDFNFELLSKQAQTELGIYRSLIHNASTNLLKRVYPLCFLFLKQKWKTHCLNYISSYPCSSPIFIDIASEFADFLQAKNIKTELDQEYPGNLLAELARYEWISFRLKSMEENNRTTRNPSLCSCYQIHKFKYSIIDIVECLEINKTHKLSEATKNKLKTILNQEGQNLIIYRDDYDHKVKYLILTPILELIVESIAAGKSISDIARIVHPKSNNSKLKETENDLIVVIEELEDKGLYVTNIID